MASALPTTMKGVIIERTGGVDVLQYRTDLPLPQPQPGQILVKNDLAGINYIDTYFRSGLYPCPHFPYSLGREAAGTVAQTASQGDMCGLQPGDRVVWLGEAAYAEYSATPADRAVKIPAGMETRTAAAVLLQGLTALTLIREAHHVQRGDWVLVHAAAGGTGLWLCQLLNATGAHVIGTASTAEKVDVVRRTSASTHMVNYTTEDVREAVTRLTDGHGCVAVFDGVGRSTFDLSLDCVARKGSLVSFGNASGAVPPVTISRLSAKNVRLMRPQLFGYIATREEFAKYTREMLDLVERGEVEVRIHEVYPLSEVRRSHEDLEGRVSTGKLLLDVTK